MARSVPRFQVRLFMAIEDIPHHRSTFPDHFEDRPPPFPEDAFVAYEGDLYTKEQATQFIANVVQPGDDKSVYAHVFKQDAPASLEAFSDARAVNDPVDRDFPGAWQGFPAAGVLPTPDQLACYLPFHYFEEEDWGVHLFDEPLATLRAHLASATGGRIPEEDLARIVLRFGFYHEVFHHKTEAFATRLEVTHRQPLYRTGFERLYRRTFGTDDCLEEALASAHSVRKLEAVENLRKLPELREALLAYLEDIGPGYRRVREFLTDKPFREGQAALAEDHQVECLGAPRVDPRVWLATSHFFDPMGSRFSKFIYHIRKDDPKTERILLRPLLKPRKVLQILRKHFGVTTEEGGSHTKLYRPNGKQSSLPRHKRDVATNTLRRILNQLEIHLSLREFQQLG